MIPGAPRRDAPVLPLAKARRRVAAWRRAGERVAFTNGCFDLVHAGHIRILSRARAAADRLVVGINSDASVRRLKGPGRPKNPLRDRVTVIGALRAVDLVVVFAEATPIRLVRGLAPDVLVKGADYPARKIVGAREVRARGGRVVRVPLLPGRSTTRLLR